MKEKKMEDLKVFVDDGMVCMGQDFPGEDEHSICIHPDQVDLLIQWLTEAKNEAKG